MRRRRTQRHRRNRRIRRALTVFVCAIFTFGVAFVALHYLTPSLFRSSRGPTRQAAEASRAAFLAAQQSAERQFGNRPVYPYSVVPGGVQDASELKWAAQHDPVVASHYAGFDYDHARVVRLVLARTAYVSYRIGNRIYWTRHRIKLKKGETVITDGKITARTRCANRVQELPQQAASESEPSAAKFDEPVNPLLGTAITTPPVPFESSLLNPQQPVVPGGPPLSLYNPIGGGGPFIPISMPPLPGVCNPITKKPTKGGTPAEAMDAVQDKKKKKGDPCANGGGVVETPEPATWLLVASGLGLLFWKTRQQFSRA